MTKVKWLDKARLTRLNNLAIKRGYNRAIERDVVDALPDYRFPVIFAMPHDDVRGRHTMRLLIVFHAGGAHVCLDIPTDEYEALPVAVIDNVRACAEGGQ
jgi:hypothetical protein